MTQEWLLKRNCSLSPRQAGIAYGLLCFANLAIAMAFAVQGFWLVLAFAFLEVVGIAFALLHYTRHATDLEHIALSDTCLLVERIDAGQVRQIRLDPYWARIALPDRKQKLIRLESRGVRVEVGSYVSEQTRQRVARELRGTLRSSSFLEARGDPAPLWKDC